MSVEDDDSARLAAAIRLKLGVDSFLRLDMPLVIKRAKDSGLIGDYLVVADEQLPDAEAKYDPSRRVLSVRRSVWDAEGVARQRAKFTLAHELGHAVSGHRETRNRTTTAKRFEKAVPRIQRDEREANRFAAAFLAPFAKARFDLNTTPEELADRFDISLAAAKVRHEEFQRAYRRKHRIERTPPASVVDFLEEARKKGYAVKSLPQPSPIARVSKRSVAEAVPVVRSYLQAACYGCSQATLAMVGTKVHCETCGATYDRFQDGDAMDG